MAPDGVAPRQGVELSLETGLVPTVPQTQRCFQLCQNLTSLYLSLELVRLDERTGNVVLLAGEEVFIEIYPNGNWRFINET